MVSIEASDNGITKVRFEPDVKPRGLKAAQQLTGAQQTVMHQLDNYFLHKKPINLSLYPQGTPFQLRVWQALQQIPWGKTMTYGELAKKLQTCAQAVGQACKRNPIPIMIPCHRVVAAHGMGGYAGQSQGKLVNVKTWLLKHEQAI